MGGGGGVPLQVLWSLAALYKWLIWLSITNWLIWLAARDIEQISGLVVGVPEPSEDMGTEIGQLPPPPHLAICRGKGEPWFVFTRSSSRTALAVYKVTPTKANAEVKEMFILNVCFTNLNMLFLV